MIFSEKYGNDIDEAVELALKDLKVEKDEVDIEVLEEPSKGFLGLGSKLAKVRVTVKGSEKEEKIDRELEEIIRRQSGDDVPQAAEANGAGAVTAEAQEADSQNNVSETSVTKSFVANRPEDLSPADDHKAVVFLKKTTEEMGMTLSFKAMANDENVYVDISGDDAGNIIGKRGQTLDAVQYLTSLAVNKDSDVYIRVVLDAENYRAKREKTLQQLADRLAGKAVRSKRPVRLEPMNPYERMIIHAALQNNSKVITRSEGEDPYRRLIIEPKR